DLGTNAAANNNEDQQLFAKGKVAMIENGDWITAGLPSEVKFPIGVLPFLAEASWNTVFWPVTPGMNKAQLDIANLLAPAYLTGKNVPQAVSAAAWQAADDLATAGRH